MNDATTSSQVSRLWIEAYKLDELITQAEAERNLKREEVLRGETTAILNLIGVLLQNNENKRGKI